MPWVSLKAFALSPRPTQKSFSGSFPALPIPQRAQKSGSAWASACHPGTVCSSAEQEYKGGGWAGFWEGGWARRNQQQKAEGCNKPVSCGSCDKLSSQHVFSKAGGFSVDFGQQKAQSRETWMRQQFGHLHPSKAPCPQPHMSQEQPRELGHSDVWARLRAWRKNRQRFPERSFRGGISV